MRSSRLGKDILLCDLFHAEDCSEDGVEDARDGNGAEVIEGGFKQITGNYKVVGAGTIGKVRSFRCFER